MAHTVVTELGFATAEDGARLDRDVYIPSGTGPWPAIIIFHAPGFKNGSPYPGQMRNWLEDSADRGIIAYAPTTRALGPPFIPGQLVDGFFPTQINDAKRACLATLADTTRCNGQYVVGGGSGGASLAAYLALDTTTQASPVAWDTTKRPLGAILFSVGSDFSDRTLPEDNIDYFTFVSEGWTNIQDPDSVTQRLRSPVAFVTAAAKPLYIVDGGNHEIGDTGNDAMPAAQRFRMVEALNAAGVTNYVSVHVPTGGHAFSNYPNQKGATEAWVDALFAGEPPPPPPPVIGITRGVASLTAGGKPVAAGARSSPNIRMISLRVPWWRVQPNPITFDFSYFQTEMAAALLVNPNMRFNLLVQTGDGSEFLNGFKPNWLFTILSGTGNHVLSGCTTGVGSSTVTCSATLTGADVGKRVYVSAYLNGRLEDLFGQTVWVGAVLGDPHQITISSSPTSNVPVNALFTNPGALVEIWTVGGAALDSHVIVPGTTYSFSNDGGAKIVTIPTFWNDSLQRRKRLLVTMMGKWWNALPPDQRNAVNLDRMSFLNANGDDWDIPEDDTAIDIPGQTLTQAQRWLHLPGDVAPGAGYTVQKVLDAIVTKTPTDQTFTTGIIQGFNLKAREAGFSVLDVGKVITGVGVGPGNENTIVNIQPGDDQQGAIAVLRVAGTNGNVTFTIPVRKTGLFDVLIAAFPDIEIGHSIAQNAGIIDKPDADIAGDSDVKNFLARSLNTLLQAAYKPLDFTQKNGISATTIRASKPPPPTGGYGLFKEISDSAPVGGQALWRVTGDTEFLMNGGSRTDKDLVPPSGSLTDDEILRRSGERIFGYNAYIYEIYEADVLALPEATGYINDLLLSLGPPPPPPPDDTPVITSPPTATGTVGVFFEYFVTATNDPIGFNLNPQPAGLAFMPATGRLFGVPITPGVYTITLSAFNENGPGEDAILTLTILAPPVPVITSPLLAHAQVGVHFEYQITADNNPTSFNFHPQPAGIAFMPATGLAFGVPITPGTVSIELTATNENGTSEIAILTLIIAPAAVIVPPPPSPIIIGIPKIPVCRSGTHARNIIVAHKGAVPEAPQATPPGPVELLLVVTPGIADSGEATATWISPAGSDPNNLIYKMVLTGGPGTIVIVSQIEI